MALDFKNIDLIGHQAGQQMRESAAIGGGMLATGIEKSFQPGSRKTKDPAKFMRAKGREYWKNIHSDMSYEDFVQKHGGDLLMAAERGAGNLKYEGSKNLWSYKGADGTWHEVGTPPLDEEGNIDPDKPWKISGKGSSDFTKSLETYFPAEKDPYNMKAGQYTYEVPNVYSLLSGYMSRDPMKRYGTGIPSESWKHSYQGTPPSIVNQPPVPPANPVIVANQNQGSGTNVFTGQLMPGSPGQGGGHPSSGGKKLSTWQKWLGYK